MPPDTRALMHCPVCGLPISLLSRNESYISVGCETCLVSRTVTIDEWRRAIGESTIDLSARSLVGATPMDYRLDRRKTDVAVPVDRRRRALL